MAIREKQGSRAYVLSTDGGNAQRIFTCTPDEALLCVRPFEPFPRIPRLKCRQITVTPITPNKNTNKIREAELVEVVAEYAAIQAEEDTPTIEIEAGGRVLETGLGRTWWSDGKRVEQAVGTFYATMILNISFTMRVAPMAHIQNALNKVNYSTFMGCPRETLLFENASISKKFDWNTGEWKDRITYRFNYQPCPWNVVWRAPQIRKDALGNYVVDDNGNYVYQDEGKWDRYMPDLYEMWDFGPLFGWPPTARTFSVEPTQVGAGFGGSFVKPVKEDEWKKFLDYNKTRDQSR